jgi:methyl-accepting chemotaxis protein
MDETTQHNAAMVVETSAAAQGLADEAERLVDEVSRFRTAERQHSGDLRPGIERHLLRETATAAD